MKDVTAIGCNMYAQMVRPDREKCYVSVSV